nr:iron-containing alcohol dehydrogenase [Methylobacterium indicum]
MWVKGSFTERLPQSRGAGAPWRERRCDQSHSDAQGARDRRWITLPSARSREIPGWTSNFELTLTCPSVVTVATGIDALTHALEALVNRNGNPCSTIVGVGHG